MGESSPADEYAAKDKSVSRPRKGESYPCADRDREISALVVFIWPVC